MIVVCVSITSLAVPASAVSSVITLDSLPNFDENYTPSSLINYSIDDKIIVNKSQIEDVVEIIVSNDDIEIEGVLYSEYIDVFGKLNNGKYVNITDCVECEFDDKSIATWSYGRIIADKAGTTAAVLKYNGFSKSITVTVNNQLVIECNDLQCIVAENGVDVTAVIDPNVGERASIISIAEEMVYMKWTPTQTFTAYGDHENFQAGVTYTGMPYTQFHNQSTYAQFISALNNSSSNDFYESYTSGNITMSRYGNDCSGFVSICWGLYRDDTWRDRWNTTDFRNAVSAGTYTSLDYSDLLPGDALVKRGHIMLVKSVSTSTNTITVYEQTDKSARMSVYTFETLKTGGYKGFSKF